MTTLVDVLNNALQVIGTKTTVTQNQYDNNLNNEAIQGKIAIEKVRDDLLRMAPWDCGMKQGYLRYITSLPGTPENTSPATTLWVRGQPLQPWIYEYQYPVDCLRACWIIPNNQLGYGGTTPLTTAVTGAISSSWWWGKPIPFKVRTDSFYPVIEAEPATGGLGYLAGDIITVQTRGLTSEVPVGGAAQLRVLTVDVDGAIQTLEVINQILGSATPKGGSYFWPQNEIIEQDFVTRDDVVTEVAEAATFNLTFDTVGPQRVILTNQEFATMAYVQQVTDPNVMDPLFLDAWAHALGSRLAMSLTGSKDVANMAVGKTNEFIAEARKADGNEGLTVNNVTPDWMMARGGVPGYDQTGPYAPGGGGFDWGGGWPAY